MILAGLPIRSDSWGSGEFAAPRSNRFGRHLGIDYACYPGTVINSLTEGVVSKIGFPYANEEYRYVEVRDSGGFHHRYFYITPSVKKGDVVRVGDKIGTSQDIAGRYQSKKRDPMDNHVHYEILNRERDKHNPLNPEEFHRV
jgi:murein DD-endopeptidase MepM/ murein hydrolase activator NlpD